MSKPVPTPPVDSAETVEIAPGFFIPRSRLKELKATVRRGAQIKEALEEIALERFSADPLTDDLCICVPFWLVAKVERNMALQLMERSRANLAHSREVSKAAAVALAGKKH